MAFCPHCGKSVTDQASKCLACGKEFEPRAKAARFKGTMMMTPAAAAPLAPKPAAEPPKEAPKPAAPAAAPAPAPAAGAPRVTVPSKVAKHTMLGTGGMGLAPPPGALRAPTPAPPAGLPQPPPAAGSIPPAGGTPASGPAPRSANVWDADAAADTEPPPREDAPRKRAADTGGYRASQPRESLDAPLPTQRTGKLLAIGIGGLVLIVALGYLAAKFMGL
jgi:hypothetical protein